MVSVTGVTEGSVTIRGTAAGFPDGITTELVTLNLISVNALINVPLGQTISFPVTIAPNAAPVGGVLRRATQLPYQQTGSLLLRRC